MHIESFISKLSYKTLLIVRREILVDGYHGRISYDNWCRYMSMIDYALSMHDLFYSSSALIGG